MVDLIWVSWDLVFIYIYICVCLWDLVLLLVLMSEQVKSRPLAKSLNNTVIENGIVMGKPVQLTLGRCQLEWEQANCGIFLYWHGRLIEVSFSFTCNCTLLIFYCSWALVFTLYYSVAPRKLWIINQLHGAIMSFNNFLVISAVIHFVFCNA